MKLLILFTSLVLSVSASARVGETLAQINARYGDPKTTSSARPPATLANVYAKAGLGVVVHFRDGISECEVYFKQDEGGMTDAEQEAIREANSNGRKWEKVRNFSGDPEWKLDDGSLVASYTLFNKFLAVIGTDFLARANALQAQKEKAKLGGF